MVLWQQCKLTWKRFVCKGDGFIHLSKVSALDVFFVAEKLASSYQCSKQPVPFIRSGYKIYTLFYMLGHLDFISL